MRRFSGLSLALAMTVAGQAVAQPAPVIDNPNVTVRDVTLSQTPVVLDHAGGHVTVYLSGGKVREHDRVQNREPADVVTGNAGRDSLSAITGKPRIVSIDFKDGATAKYPNRAGYPTAFQRPGIRKLAQTEHYTVWSYTWQLGKPTPMHFHDTDVIVIYRGEGVLDSVTPDGKHALTSHHTGEIRFNKGDRAHYELLTKGGLGAVMVELH